LRALYLFYTPPILCYNDIMKKYKFTKLNVEDGYADYVTGAIVYRKFKDVTIIHLDMSLKRPEVLHCCSLALAGPEITIQSSTDSYFGGKKVEEGEVTFSLTLPEYVGWDVYMANPIGRYTIGIVLIKEK